MRLKKFLWAITIYLVLSLPVCALAFLNFSSLHGVILVLYLFLAAGAAYSFGRLKEERDHWMTEGVKTPLAAGADESGEGIYHERFLNLRLKEEYDRARRYQRPFSCLLIEMDSFPPLLKSHPSVPTEAMNGAMGQFLKKNLRAVDIIIRWGGQRFFTILPETGLLGARIAAERVRYLIEKNIFRSEETEIKMTVSVAAVAFDLALHSSPETIFNSLEKTLTEAKKSGPNRVAVLAQE